MQYDVCAVVDFLCPCLPKLKLTLTVLNTVLCAELSLNNSLANGDAPQKNVRKKQKEL